LVVLPLLHERTIRLIILRLLRQRPIRLIVLRLLHQRAIRLIVLWLLKDWPVGLMRLRRRLEIVLRAVLILTSEHRLIVLVVLRLKRGLMMLRLKCWLMVLWLMMLRLKHGRRGSTTAEQRT